ncbi:hypothetical protein M409DRAFT_19664 [Zasmidium cellare ATCC 36951]|uniref:Tat pathway signal sequence n=1 Tax=Zasmidium cellare ATCC 36951 TaxID=1080233 RepID=A0A6A6CSK5_ZASCE|nr:uncharacterized protein M409DRAFT_19664 [Zasmidium cellare ATCC 36951]KAF2170055.1 hypothetical protein M409DRAFT_19664 [Zasmidium cellare ATCC 36951]
MALTKDQVTKSKLRLDSVRYPPEIGEDLYMASPEVTHQLHCLNFLRKATYGEYYKDKSGEWTDSPATTRIHLDHCIEMLRQVLMCNADAGVLTMNWVESHSQPYPNFNTWHKCRNFDSVMDWVRGSALQLENSENATVWPQVPGSVVLARPP